MHLIMWELSGKHIDPETLNMELSNNNLPPLAVEDTSTKTFKQAWRKFSSMKTLKYQAHVINDKTIGIVSRDSTTSKIDLQHLATLQIKEHAHGNVQIYYICKPGEGDHLNNLRDIGGACSSCGAIVPEAALEIAETFNRQLGKLSPEGRSLFYSHYLKDIINTIPFMSAGRPYIFHDDNKDKAYNFMEAINAIGDRVFILDISTNESAKIIVKEGIKVEIEKMKAEYDKLETGSLKIRERRLETISVIKDKIELYKDILESYTDELNIMADQFTSLVLQDLLGSSAEDLPTQDSTPSEHPVLSFATPR